MAAEEITKFAINSTLGTAKFKPLDQIIVQQQGLIANDVLYKHVLIGRKYFDIAGNTEQPIYTLNIHKNGSIRVKGTLNSSRCSFIIYTNNIKSYEFKNRPGEADRDFSTDIIISNEDVIIFALANLSALDGDFISDIGIYATEYDVSGIDVTEVTE